MIGQLQLVHVPDLEQAKTNVLARKERIHNKVPSMLIRFWYPLAGDRLIIKVRLFLRLLQTDDDSSPDTWMFGMRLVRNAINTALEKISPYITEITGGAVRLRILSNLPTCVCKARCRTPPELSDYERFLRRRSAGSNRRAAAFAEVDPYRAVTHNKGNHEWN
jgi:hydroxymethylglutaryl-CoA reductase